MDASQADAGITSCTSCNDELAAVCASRIDDTSADSCLAGVIQNLYPLPPGNSSPEVFVQDRTAKS